MDVAMETNTSVLEANVTLEQIASVLNLTIANSTNVTSRIVTPEKLFNLYDAYRTKEREQLMLYKSVAYVLGTLIILSNLTVVISSGLILRKGQQPKSTYLLLGNVSLADTIIGIAIIFGTIVDNSVNSNVLCVFQIGMIVCPTLVSIFSVGLIAIDRYIYIIHGLYYQRWINTTRVRIGIIIIWFIGGILGFIPATGWINQELRHTRCYYISLFPEGIVLLNSILSIIPIVLVAVLYSIILVRALKNVKNLKSSQTQNFNDVHSQEQKIRIYRGNINNKKTNNTVKFPAKNNIGYMKRSSSTSALNRGNRPEVRLSIKSQSIENVDSNKTHVLNTNIKEDSDNKKSDDEHESKLSIWTIDSDGNSTSIQNLSSTHSLSNASRKASSIIKRISKAKKVKEPSKYRAIIVVMLTSGSFILTWMPFFVVVIFFVFCENKLANPKCIAIRALLGGPLATLAFFNSTLNPLIYAWWHRGFKKAAKVYLKKCFCKNKH